MASASRVVAIDIDEGNYVFCVFEKSRSVVENYCPIDMIFMSLSVLAVLGHFVPQLCLFHNEKYGTSLQLKDFYSYNFWEVWGGTA